MVRIILCLTLISLYSSSSLAQARPKLPNPIKQDIRRQLARELTVDNEELTKMINGLESHPMDLNGDGKPEWKVIGGYGLCGNQSCYCWIYREVGNRYELILPSGYGDDMRPSQTRTNGYRNLISSGGVFKFDGRQYQFQPRN